MSVRMGDWIQTISGIEFYPLDPRPEEIVIDDIAHALSHQCRFAGHCKEFYSVAEHSVRVSSALHDQNEPTDVCLWGLLHDASEAYLVDLPRPLKRYADFGKLYRRHEDWLMRVICAKFGLDPTMPLSVKKMDTVLLMTEKRDLMSAHPKPWEDTEEPLREVIRPWHPVHARAVFIQQYEWLLRGKQPGRPIRMRH